MLLLVISDTLDNKIENQELWKKKVKKEKKRREKKEPLSILSILVL
jgi:hypothetical protein